MRGMLADNGGSVVLTTALLTPAFMGVLALSVDVSYWQMAKLTLQRTADVAALAGALAYSQTNNSQYAAVAAASVAELNGASGAATRAWSAATQTLSDNHAIVAVVAGIRHAGDRAVQVTVSQPAPLFFGRLISSGRSLTVSATAAAETGPSQGPQPCVLALAGDGSGVTTGTDISISGNANVVLRNCTLRSDASITIGGSAVVSAAAGIYAAGTISNSGAGSVGSSPEHPQAGQIPDSYASYQPLQTALAQLGSGGQSQGSGAVLNPGVYQSLDFKGTVTLNPGLYVVNGSISFEAKAAVTGSGVTIVSSGPLMMNGNASVTLSAPGTSPVNGAVPGILYANPTAGLTLQWNGASSESLTGVLYAPNSTVKINGNSGGSGNGCLEVIAANVNILGSATLGADCASLGALSFGSLPGAVALVQ